MTSTALRVLSLALVFSIVGTTLGTDNHDSEQKGVTNEKIIRTDHNMKLRTKVDDSIDRIESLNNDIIKESFGKINVEDKISYSKFDEKETKITYDEIYDELNIEDKLDSNSYDEKFINDKYSNRNFDSNEVKTIYAETYDDIYIEDKPSNSNFDKRVRSPIYAKTYDEENKQDKHRDRSFYNTETKDIVAERHSKILRRVKREDDNKCELFIYNKKENRILHPHDKDSKFKFYYSNVECVTVIEGDLDKVVKLTFIDKFHIEDHPDCAYDYLEIRDGQHGYAKLLTGKKLCGSAFPPQITSTGSYMWLKFYSDDTIEYEGFTIKVEYEPSSSVYNPPEKCNVTLDAEYDKWEINSKDIEECVQKSENQVLDVVWTIMASENKKLYLNFSSYALAKPNECEENVVEVYGAVLQEEARLARYCGSMANSVMTKSDGKNDKGNVMYVRLFASKSARKETHFSANVTAFRPLDPAKDEKCSDEEFDCEDNTCISLMLRCDGYAHCRLKADEDTELCKTKTESVFSQTHIVVILVIFCLILSGMSFVFLFKCIRKLYQDHKIIKEHISKSCEDRLDELVDSRFTLDPMKLQRDSEPRASLERDNHTNEMFKQQRKFSQQKQSSLDSDFIQETHLDLDEPWRRDVDSTPLERDIKIERNGRTRRDTQKETEREIIRENQRERESEIRRQEEERRRSEERKEIRDASVGVPDTKESGCQTRESLFQTGNTASSDGSNTNSQGFSTFGYSGATIARPASPAPLPKTSEITIELIRQPSRPESKTQKKMSDRRPMSTETTRSAPDVIIVSKPIR